MRIESPFFEKSSVSFILTCARGLGILTIGKIKKTTFQSKNKQTGSKHPNKTTFCQKIFLLKNIYKIFCYGERLDVVFEKAPIEYPPLTQPTNKQARNIHTNKQNPHLQLKQKS